MYTALCHNRLIWQFSAAHPKLH